MSYFDTRTGMNRVNRDHPPCLKTNDTCPSRIRQEEPNKPFIQSIKGNGLLSKPSKHAAVPASLRATMIAAVQADASEQYDVTERDGHYEAICSNQALQAVFTLEGVQLTLQRDAYTPLIWGMEFIGYGYGDHLEPLQRPEFIVERNRVEYRRGNLTEWYVNGPLGIEQGFTLQERPSQSPPQEHLILRIRLQANIKAEVVGGKKLRLFHDRDEVSLLYGQLHAQDAAGQSLPTYIDQDARDDQERAVYIIVDDHNAVYPLTIDPLIEQEAKLVGDGTPHEQFGDDVCIDGDTAAVNAASMGSVFVFTRSGSTWSQQQKITGNASDSFGWTIALSGDTLVIGAASKNSNTGSVFVYTRSGSTWSQQQELTASDGVTGDMFGRNVAISGNTLVASTLFKNSSTGAAYVFTRSGSTWSQQQKLTASDAATGKQFGLSLAIQKDRAVIGSSTGGTGHGAAYVFERSGSTWTEQQKLTVYGYTSENFGTSVALDQDTIVVGGAPNDVYIFVLDGTTWVFQAKLVSTDPSEYFGINSVALAENTLVVSGYGKNDSTGAAYVYTRSGTTWSLVQELTAGDADVFEFFGEDISLDKSTALIGALNDDGELGAAYVFPIHPKAPSNTGAPDIPIIWAGEMFFDNSINIRTGEKTETYNDISVNTPVGPLEFIRTYRQNKRATFQFMGLGWTHNHALSLVKTVGTPNTLTIQLPSGGELHLSEDAPSSNHYVSDAGSDAVVDYNTGSTNYTLTTTDYTTYVFDSAGKLISRAWPDGETWTYTYTSGQLTLIDDGNDHQLQLTYVNNLGQYNHGQLWRVGDQDATGLSGGSPAGRYVEFTYTPQKSDGSPIGSPKALLYTVTDSLGNVWTYKYYGQEAGVGQTNANQLDFLLEVVSPTADTDGAGNLASISLEKLTYSINGSTIMNISHSRGDDSLVTAFAFQPNGQNITTETVQGEITTHRFDNEVYAGLEDPEKNYTSQVLNIQHRPAVLSDGNGNTTQLTWSTKGHRVKDIKDALGNVTSFVYFSTGTHINALDYRTDPDGRRTKYSYDDASHPRQPTKVQVYDKDGTTILHWEEMSYDARGRLTSEKLYDPTGTTIQKQTDRAYYTTSNPTNGYSKGHLSTLTQVDLMGQGNDIVTTHFYDKSGRVVKTTVNSPFGTCQINYTVYDKANRVVATICNYDPGMGSAPTTAAQAAALYNSAFPEKNHVTTYTYDSLGRRTHVTTDAGSASAVTTVTVYDSLNRVKRTIQNYIASSSITNPYVRNRNDFTHGANNDQNLMTDMVYNLRGKLRKQIDVLGNVTLYGYDKSLRLIRTVQNASQPNYNNDYTLGGDSGLSWYPQRAGLDTPDQDLITSMEYDKAGNAIRATDVLGNVTLSAYDKLNRPVKVIRNASRPTYNLVRDPALKYYDPVSDADQDLISITEYDEMGRVIWQQDELGSWILSVYDGLGKLIKTIRNASRPDYNRLSDPIFQFYVSSSNPDQDLITEIAYDTADRQMYTVDELGRRDWTAYDGVGRASKVIQNAIGKAMDNKVDDPRSSNYRANTSPSDQDQISLIHYDGTGRRWRTRDNLGNWTLYGYDTLNRPIKVIQNASNFAYDTINDAALSRYMPAIGAADDQDIITETTYDGQGRVATALDALGVKTVHTYDALGRKLKTVQNFVNGTYDTLHPDQDLTSTATYDIAGRMLSSVDARGKQTTFVYDLAGRRKLITEAATTSQAVNTYRCYDKAGRMLRLIQNWLNDPTQPSPDARDTQGNWLFNPVSHGAANDQNLITTFIYDKTGRLLSASNPIGNTTSTSYTKAGQVTSTTDALGVVTQIRYDLARRRVLTVQNYQSNGEDPALWKWNGSAWTKSNGSTAITFGTAKDQNIITQVEYDKAGRQTALRDPRGKRTTYTYDQLDRRVELKNPLNKLWATTYLNLLNGGSRMTLADPNGNSTQHDYDRLGREIQLQYLNESPKLTPDVTFTYNKVGNRLSMSEYNGATLLRNTIYTYDEAQRLAKTDFDNDGSGSIDDTVNYTYDAGGLRTQITLPGSLNVSYSYDTLGKLTSLTDWDSQATQFTYDGVQRLASAQRANNLVSSYQYDPAGRLTLLRHTASNQTLGHFAYTVDARGNRTQLYQGVPRTTTGSTTLAYNDASIDYYQGTWTNASPYKVSTSTNANLRLVYLSSQVTLTMGKGPDHGIYDIYVDGAFQQTVDGYAASAGDQATVVILTDEGPHTLEIRNTGTKNASSSSFKVRFKTLVTPVSARLYDLQTTVYTYDGVSRIATANTYPGINVNAAAAKGYAYSFDVAGNRTQQVVTVAGSPTTTNYTYNDGNQLTNVGATTYGYDNNGNSTTVNGSSTNTYDRANRLLSSTNGVTTLQYAYDGIGNRTKQINGANTTQYLLDLQMELVTALSATTGANVNRYVQGLHGLHAQKNTAGSWGWTVQDGLGSVVSMVDNSAVPLESRQYSPYGEPSQISGSSQTDFGYTAEMADVLNLLYLRARYFVPSRGNFINLDPAETANRYAYVEGNPINRVDPSGLACIPVDDEGTMCYKPKPPQPPKPPSPPPTPPPPTPSPYTPGWGAGSGGQSNPPPAAKPKPKPPVGWQPIGIVVPLPQFTKVCTWGYDETRKCKPKPSHTGAEKGKPTGTQTRGFRQDRCTIVDEFSCAFSLVAAPKSTSLGVIQNGSKQTLPEISLGVGQGQQGSPTFWIITTDNTNTTEQNEQTPRQVCDEGRTSCRTNCLIEYMAHQSMKQWDNCNSICDTNWIKCIADAGLWPGQSF